MSTQHTSTPMEIGTNASESNMVESNVGESNVGAPSMNVETNLTPNDEVESLLPTEIEGRQRKLTSNVWNHFKKQKRGEKMRAICNYCGVDLLGASSQGTSHLRKQFLSCTRRTTRDIRQAFIKTENVGNETVVVGSYAFNQDVARRSAARMIVLHEYPMKMVEHIGFKDFCASMQPLFKVVSRNTIKNDIIKRFQEEKESTLKLLSKNQSRFAITTDMWTASHQNKGYMTVTTHFIDDSWTLQSRLVRFIYVPAPHTAKVLADVLVGCLMDWNLDRKLSTLTVDNCSTNDAMIKEIFDKIPLSSLILRGQFFHMRCCAHILNLIVRDGLLIISKTIENVRESVDFWRATPKREEKFIETCGQLSMSYNKKLISDCKTRWNSTFLMLKVAIEYKDVFRRLAQREAQYKTLPSESDWMMANEICVKLEIFYEVTRLFSGTLYPTANVYFPKVCVIKLSLIEWLQSPDSVIYTMAASMNEKFDKYWGVINEVMVVGIMLDPRYKLYMVDIFFPGIYGEKAREKIAAVKSICQDLVNEYEMKIKGKESVSSSSSSNSNVDLSVRKKDPWKLKFDEYVSTIQNVSSGKSELDRYLEEKVLPATNEEFDILGWWKANGAQYPILQMIARDFLAIPISTVASESSFSTGGRVLTPHRSKLRPDTLEAFMCLQDWLWTEMKGSSKSKVENIEFNGVLEDADVDIETSEPIGAT